MPSLPRSSSARPLTVLLAVTGALCLVLTACGGSTKKAASSPSVTPSSSSAPASSSAPVSTSAAASSTAAGTPVHLRLLNTDGATYGVGEPIVIYSSARLPDGDAVAKATTVKVNGQVVEGAWHWEDSSQITGYPIEGHFRANAASGASTPYWPAHATIDMALATQNVPTGTNSGQYFDDSLTLHFATGPANISYVDCSTEKMQVTSDGNPVKTVPTSCGAAKTPTFTGTKIVMQKGEDVPGTNTLRPNGEVRMVGPGYDEIVGWSVRVTQSGEYVHAASWNGQNIGVRSTSNGCTNLNPADAQWFYNFTQLGDVVLYANTGGTTMPSWDGLGDWNLPQSEFNNETPDS